MFLDIIVKQINFYTMYHDISEITCLKVDMLAVFSIILSYV